MRAQGLHASGVVVGLSLTFQARSRPISPSPHRLARGRDRTGTGTHRDLATVSPDLRQAAVEVPIFRLSGWLIEAFGGVRPALLTTSLAGALRMCGWWAATDPLAVLPFEVGHGWSFALACSRCWRSNPGPANVA